MRHKDGHYRHILVRAISMHEALRLVGTHDAGRVNRGAWAASRTSVRAAASSTSSTFWDCWAAASVWRFSVGTLGVFSPKNTASKRKQAKFASTGQAEGVSLPVLSRSTTPRSGLKEAQARIEQLERELAQQSAEVKSLRARLACTVEIRVRRPRPGFGRAGYPVGYGEGRFRMPLAVSA